MQMGKNMNWNWNCLTLFAYLSHSHFLPSFIHIPPSLSPLSPPLSNSPSPYLSLSHSLSISPSLSPSLTLPSPSLSPSPSPLSLLLPLPLFFFLGVDLDSLNLYQNTTELSIIISLWTQHQRVGGSIIVFNQIYKHVWTLFNSYQQHMSSRASKMGICWNEKKYKETYLQDLTLQVYL